MLLNRQRLLTIALAAQKSSTKIPLRLLSDCASAAQQIKLLEKKMHFVHDWKSLSEKDKSLVEPKLAHKLNLITYFHEMHTHKLIETRIENNLELKAMYTKFLREGWEPQTYNKINEDLYIFCCIVFIPIFRTIFETKLNTITSKKTILTKYVHQLIELDNINDWESKNDNEKDNYDEVLRNFLDEITIPIYSTILSSEFKNERILMDNHSQLRQIYSMDRWRRMTALEKENIRPELKIFLDYFEHSTMAAKLYSFEEKLDSKISSIFKVTQNLSTNSYIETERITFCQVLGEFFVNEKLPDISGCLSGLDLTKLSNLSDIRSDKIAKNLLGPFFKPHANDSIPIPIYKQQIKIQYLGILDKTKMVHNQELFETATDCLNNTNQNTSNNNFFSVINSPHGAGETHDLLKLGSTYFCLLFNGTIVGAAENISEPGVNFATAHFSVSPAAEIGFKDESVGDMVNICQSLIASTGISSYAMNFLVEYYTQLLILSRLLYLEKLKTILPNLTPDMFLLAQLNDYSTIARGIYKRLCDAKISPMIVRGLISNKMKQFGNSIFGVLDEANTLPNQTIVITYRGLSNCKRSILASVAKALVKELPMTFFAGVKFNLTTSLTIANAVGTDLQKTIKLHPKFMKSIDDVKETLSQLIDISGCDKVFLKYQYLLTGARIRFVMKILTFIPNCQHLKRKSNQLDEAIRMTITNCKKSIISQIDVVWKKSSDSKQKVLFDFLASFVLQFLSCGKYKIAVSDLQNLNLVSILCEVVHEGDKEYYFSSEVISFEAVLQFLHNNGLHLSIPHF